MTYLSDDKKYFDDKVYLSNKGCPRYYNIPDGSWAGYCDCPSGHCYYDEQKARRRKGKLAMRPEYWLKTLKENDES